MLFSRVQRGKILEGYSYLDGKYLLSIDGTEFFNSSKIHCDNCCEKHHRDGSTTYHHQMVAGAVVHPSHKNVIPIAPEPISKQDGCDKNDCERVASERFLRNFRREHPHLPVIVTEDGLASNAPHIKLLNELDCNYILGCKKSDHKALFKFVDESDKLGNVQHVTIHEGKIQHKFRFMNQVSLNKAHPDCLVNFMDYEEIKANGKKRFSWVTDIELDNNNLMKIMKGGRTRWKIENETFNTLKNRSYNFEHNFGHGHQNLGNNLATLNMLVFAIDQIQELACKAFQTAKKKFTGHTIWEKIRDYFEKIIFTDWHALFTALIYRTDFTGTTKMINAPP